MPVLIPAGLLPVLLLVLAAEFVNGWTDAPNAIATVVSTRVLTPSAALGMATVLNVVGTMAGTAVAATIGKGIVNPETIDTVTIAAAMVAIVTWSTLAWLRGLPTSESHALVAALAGAGLATAGPQVLQWEGWRKVLIGLGFSTLLGFGGGCGLMVGIAWLFRRTPLGQVRRVFGRAQVLSAAFMAFSHGTNDGQKFIGVFTLALLLGGVIPEFRIPFWVILLCALTMGLGTAVGGWRIVHTMGLRLTRLESFQGFAAETAAASAIELATRLGIPLSTTHTINTAIMGVGATRRLSAVRWGVGLEIVTAWVLTFPACALIAALVTWVLRLIL
ncbi:MAG: inorganic phosphate transporter [Armatimonadota bacterium]|nr:inorganic phosphate transporter [Armatimonadota bacterium]MDR7450953.1 inorganic phosphate transporter [Armatimonadota bacterium]MDR7465875.1 inorganic phosphate transporter [Armatimonadota bacterium]MDR7493783.1 inorganic phosphate transporter [Armatimonadota bacterium]MDR7498389.1 inorganic phosphate transporter [Armatimonadota bacterium]